MKPIYLLALLILTGCKLPDKWITGAYVNGDGDSLKIKTDRSFRVEMVNPDTAVKKQLRFTSGRWHTVGRKLHLTVATESMGDYWQCVPMKVRLRHLKRPIECTGDEGSTMNFKKVHVRKKAKKARHRKKDELPDE
jgi:hypothetical protein